MNLVSKKFHIIKIVLFALFLGFLTNHFVIQATQTIDPEYTDIYIVSEQERQLICQSLELRLSDLKPIKVTAGFPLKLVDNSTTDVYCGGLQIDGLYMNDYLRFKNFYINWIIYSSIFIGILYFISQATKKKR